MRELIRVEVHEVSGGVPALVAGSIIGGSVGLITYAVGNKCITPQGVGVAIVEGAITGAFTGGTAAAGIKAFRATSYSVKAGKAIESTVLGNAAAATTVAGGVIGGDICPANTEGSGGASMSTE